MAYEGELVKMENGRWARFQRCQVTNPTGFEGDDTTILVAVELDDRSQDLLSAAEVTFAARRPMTDGPQLRLENDGLSFVQDAAPMH